MAVTMAMTRAKKTWTAEQYAMQCACRCLCWTWGVHSRTQSSSTSRLWRAAANQSRWWSAFGTRTCSEMIKSETESQVEQQLISDYEKSQLRAVPLTYAPLCPASASLPSLSRPSEINQRWFPDSKLRRQKLDGQQLLAQLILFVTIVAIHF